MEEHRLEDQRLKEIKAAEKAKKLAEKAEELTENLRIKRRRKAPRDPLSKPTPDAESDLESDMSGPYVDDEELELFCKEKCLLREALAYAIDEMHGEVASYCEDNADVLKDDVKLRRLWCNIHAVDAAPTAYWRKELEQWLKQRKEKSGKILNVKRVSPSPEQTPSSAVPEPAHFSIASSSSDVLVPVTSPISIELVDAHHDVNIGGKAGKHEHPAISVMADPCYFHHNGSASVRHQPIYDPALGSIVAGHMKIKDEQERRDGVLFSSSFGSNQPRVPASTWTL